MKTNNSTTFRVDLQHQRLQTVYRAHLNSVAEHTGRLVAGQKTRDGLALGEQLMDASVDRWSELRVMWENTPQKIWIWSDLHVSHKNISQHAGRPFDNIRYMNQTLQNNAQCVADDDIVLCLGDVSFDDAAYTQEWLAACPGRKYLILGNHDIDRAHKIQSLPNLGFEGIGECLVLPHQNQLLWFTHYPIARHRLPHNVVNVHGHTHQHRIDGPYLNVCVEHLDYTPQRLAVLLEC